MSEPDWKQSFYDSVTSWVSGGDIVKTAAYLALLDHIEAAYQRGLQAGRSQAGYGTRRKSKEGPCRTGTAGAAGSTPALSTEGGEP